MVGLKQRRTRAGIADVWTSKQLPFIDYGATWRFVVVLSTRVMGRMMRTVFTTTSWTFAASKALLQTIQTAPRSSQVSCLDVKSSGFPVGPYLS